MDDSGDSGDFELEVTDLRTGQHKRVCLDSPPASGHIRRRPVMAREALAPIMVAPPRHTAAGLLRLAPLRGARLASAAVLAVLLLIAALVIGSNPAAPAALSAIIHLPPPTRTTLEGASEAGENGFLAVDGVPWGTLLIDGRRDPRANTHLEDFQGSFTLPPGQHTVEYLAAPFPTIHCIVTIPAKHEDTCPLISPQQAGTLADPFPLATRILDLRATPAHLAPAQQVALVGAIQAAMAERAPVEAATVLPGERYVTADGSVAVATQPLRATYLYDFQWDARRGLRDCDSLCVRSRSMSPYPDVWIVSAHVRQGWHYTTPDGVPVIAVAPPVATNVAPLTPSGISATDIFINLYVRWTGHWQVSTLSLAEFGDPYAAPTCAVGFEALLRVMGSANVSFTPIPPSRIATGCLFLVQRFAANGTLTGHPLYYFFRFGVLLAVNAPARAALPTLPAANPAEQSLVRLIAAQAGQPPS